MDTGFAISEESLWEGAKFVPALEAHALGVALISLPAPGGAVLAFSSC
jgi:hypothetical protein